MEEHNWINIFFMVLVIILIVSGICWFFGISIPNFHQISIKADNSFKPVEIPTTIVTIGLEQVNTSRAELIKGLGVLAGTQAEKQTLDMVIENICYPLCTKNNIGGGTPNPVVYSYDGYYFDTNDYLVCKCKRVM